MCQVRAEDFLRPRKAAQGGRVTGQGPLPGSGELAFPGLDGAQAPGSSCAGNWGPGTAARRVWGTKDAPEYMEPGGVPEGGWRTYL